NSARTSEIGDSVTSQKPRSWPLLPFVATASHPHDDLADLLVRLQVAMSLDNLLKREGLGDDRLQAAISQAVGDEAFTALQPGRVAGRVERDLRQPKATQDDGLSDQ